MDRGAREWEVNLIMEEGQRKDLTRYKDDEIFVPELLSQIEDEGVRKRISNEVCTYMVGAKKYKRRHYFFEVIMVVLPLMVSSIEILLKDSEIESVIIIVLSLVSAIFGRIIVYQKAFESWKRYRKYLEISKREIFSYLHHIGKYKDMEKSKEIDNLFLESMEQIFVEESYSWNEMREENAKHKGK